MPLTDLQVRVASIVASTPGADDFALAGGAALMVSGIGSRATNDLDYFATRRDVVDELAPAVESRLREAGLGVQVIRSSPGFVRYHVTDGADITELDLAWDYRMRAPRQSVHGPILDPDELAADKMLALYGRAEARDFVDVYRLRERHSRERLCELAAEKDRGFDRSMFAETLAQIDRRDRVEFDVDDTAYDALRREFAQWQDEALHEPPETNYDA